MRYPTLSSAAAAELAALLVAGQPLDPDAHVVVQGTGTDLGLDDFQTLGAQLSAEAQSLNEAPGRVDRDRFEGEAGRRLHGLTADLPIPVLDDPGFWAFLTVHHFWDFVVWRETTAFRSEDPGRYLRYIDGRLTTECVLTRMVLRARIAATGDHSSLADAIPFAADFWRSHVLRVGVAHAPLVACASARAQLEDRMDTNELREFARRLNRVTTNIIPRMLDRREARALVDSLRESRS